MATAVSDRTTFDRIWDGVWHSRNARQVITDHYADAFAMHISSLSRPIDRGTFIDFVAGWQRAFPDGRMEIRDVIGDGNCLWCYWLSTGTHQADYLGVPATGRRVAYEGVDIYRFAGDRIAECWAVPDVLTLLRQLGVVPG